MHIHKVYLRSIGETTEMCPRELATMTLFACTDKLASGEEYGLAVTISEVVDELPADQLETVTQEMERYAQEHSA